MISAELQDIHSALMEIEIVDTFGDLVPLVSGIYIVSSGLVFPEDSNNDVAFAWESSNPGVVANDGIVNRQGIDVPVMLTVTGANGRYGQKKRFYLNVQAL